MRPSRVTALSLCRRDLVYDPGGLRHASPYRRRRILRSSTMKLSAVHVGEQQASFPSVYPVWDHNFRTTFEAQYKPRRLASPGFRPLSPPADEFSYWAGG